MLILMGLILKIPITAACWLIWYAVRSEPDPVEGEEATDDGHEDTRFRRDRRPRKPAGHAARAEARTLPTLFRSPVPRTTAGSGSPGPPRSPVWLPASARRTARLVVGLGRLGGLGGAVR